MANVITVVVFDQDKGAPAFLESMERFGRVIAFSTAPEGTETHNFSSDNVGMSEILTTWLTVTGQFVDRSADDQYCQ